MKRSQINMEIKNAIGLFNTIGFRLPPFAFWHVQDWQKKGPETLEIIENKLGWDVTDYGCNDFDKQGLLLFTIRNGNSKKKQIYSKTYAEKLMVIKEGQLAPMHFHWKKKEDVINRGGGNLEIVLHRSNENETLSDEAITVSIDGIRKSILPGKAIVLTPGESIFIEPFVYHCFFPQTGTGPVVIGEVSEVNDDDTDNRFLDPIGRFPDIEEDEPPLHLLCTEYTTWINHLK